ncbi:hypothetical protein M885DRAFT_554898 [Pelagophyceae sp. CCMP2097]|nr:hypothetical protein M885DRAFT_554898 [Pelagophyceae sp. CCMP2097]
MYADKFIHKNVQTENGRYVTIGDPYKQDKDHRPPRWRGSQMAVPGHPKNDIDGYFKGLVYVPDKYVEQLPYTKTQPFAERKRGFGTHDAKKRDEFTQRIRTEQYRDLLKREKRLLARGVVDVKLRDKVAAMLAEGGVSAAEERKKVNLDAPRHLYDVGRSRETAFDSHLHSDHFYNTFEARKREMRRGGMKTASQDIGEGAWAVKPPTNEHGRSHATRTFYSRGHIEVQDI